MVEITKIEQTIYGCPSQWEGTLNDGRTFFARYRWGWLEFDTYPNEDLHFNSDFETTIFEEQVGGPYDGIMCIAEMCRHVGIHLSKDIEWLY
jgi:hypothetical protein